MEEWTTCLQETSCVFQMKIEAISNDKEALAESMLRTQFRMELIVYTQDCRYSKKLGKRKREESGRENEAGANLKEMMRHLKSYYEVRLT